MHPLQIYNISFFKNDPESCHRYLEHRLLFQWTQVWFPIPPMAAHDCNFSSRGSDSFLWSPRTSGTYIAHRHTCWQNNYAHKNKMNLKKWATNQNAQTTVAWIWVLPFPLPADTASLSLCLISIIYNNRTSARYGSACCNSRTWEVGVAGSRSPLTTWWIPGQHELQETLSLK